ncbi:hypothetical protein WOLCODRAFT_15347 [Wolfiporia cocos MD-104 SS10]|uniref:F-box domain-containing protein n=1 Tax=Wolfiporia cocos (strain MD-104) TaxID=742152 RepID=A0A2H3IWV7_WOLCO|nr:hypothetical protein WOLCODRAFT_15347 [Wolfiporia cocos MD-104 SS10]
MISLQRFSSIAELHLSRVRFRNLQQFGDLVCALPRLGTLRLRNIMGLESRSDTVALGRRTTVSVLSNFELYFGEYYNAALPALTSWIGAALPNNTLTNISVDGGYSEITQWTTSMNQLLRAAGQSLRSIHIDNMCIRSQERRPQGAPFIPGFIPVTEVPIDRLLNFVHNTHLRSISLDLVYKEGAHRAVFNGWLPWLLSHISSGELTDIEVYIPDLTACNDILARGGMPEICNSVGFSEIDAIISTPQFERLQHVRFLFDLEEVHWWIDGDDIAVDHNIHPIFWTETRRILATKIFNGIREHMPLTHARGILSLERC